MNLPKSLRRHFPRRMLPGFGLTLGYTLLYLSAIVLIPLSATFLRAAHLTWPQFWATVTSARVVYAYALSFGGAFLGSAINGVFGLVVAWTLVRYRFPGRALLDAVVDLPFALPTAVAGIALTALYSRHGWMGCWLEPLGIKVAYTRLGVLVALTFVGLPFIVRTLQPVLEGLDPEVEEAAATLGARRWQVFARIILPAILPAYLTGFALSFSRALGEYGSVIFISGNLPFKTEIAPVIIVGKLEQFDYAGAAAVSVVMLVASFTLLLFINLVQRWAATRGLAGA